MKNAKSYAGGLRRQEKVLTLLKEFTEWFDEYDTKGYLFAETKMDHTIDLIVGSEKFTIVANIQAGGKVVFDVFGWEFDLSSLTKYTSKRIENLTMICGSNSLEFKHVMYDEDNRDFKIIIDLDRKAFRDYVASMERFFNQVEIYIDNQNSVREAKS